MIKNALDDRLYEVYAQHDANPEALLGAAAEVLQELGEELKAAWPGKRPADCLARELVDECLAYATRSLEEWNEWDDRTADQLMQLYGMANQARLLRSAVGWASASADLEVRQLLQKLEAEAHMIFAVDALEYLDGVAFRLLTWLNARRDLIAAYRGR